MNKTIRHTIIALVAALMLAIPTLALADGGTSSGNCVGSGKSICTDPSTCPTTIVIGSGSQSTDLSSLYNALKSAASKQTACTTTPCPTAGQSGTVVGGSASLTDILSAAGVSLPAQTNCPSTGTTAKSTAAATTSAAKSATAASTSAAKSAVSALQSTAAKSCTSGNCATSACTSGNCAKSACTSGNCAKSACTSGNCATSACTSGNCATSACPTSSSLKQQLQQQLGTLGNVTSTLGSLTLRCRNYAA